MRCLRWACWKLAAVGMLGAALAGPAMGGETGAQAIEPLQAAEVLDSLYSGITGYRWKYRLEFLKARNPKAMDIAGLGLAPHGPEFGAGSAVVDVRTLRYVVEYDSVRRWSGGAAEYISERGAQSFDGKTYRKWLRSRHGTTLPSLDPELFEVDKSNPRKVILGPLSGSVESADRERFLQVFAGEMGLRDLPPFSRGCGDLEPFPQKLRKWAQAKAPLQITQRSGGQWECVFPDPGGDDLRYRVVLDPMRGGVATLEERFHADLPGAPVWCRTFVRVAASKGVWYPCESVWVNVLDGTAYRVLLTDMEVNPDLSREGFQVRFPVGTVVDDSVLQKTYTVGAGAQRDADAVRRYMERHGLGPFGAREAGVKRLALRVAISLASAAAIAGCAVWLWRRRTRKTPPPILLLVATWALWGASACAETPAQRAVEVGSSSGGPATSCCAFNISVLALELFGRAYEPQVLLQTLQPRWGEVSLARLAEVLEGHGLRVEARQGIRWRDLFERLPDNTLAICPLPAAKRYHYVGVVRGKGNRVMLLDPPAVALDLGDVVRGASAPGGRLPPPENLIVLFVWLPSSARHCPMADHLAIEPEVVSVRETTETQGTVTGVVDVANRGALPIMVSEVRTTCGCTQVSWLGGMLKAGQKVTLRFGLRTTGSGAESRSERIILQLPDGSQREVVVHAEFAGRPAVASSPESKRATLELPAVLDSAGFETVHDFGVYFPLAKRGALQLASDSAWLRPALAEDEGRLRLLASGVLSQGQLEALRVEDAKWEGVITVREPGTRTATQVHYTVLRKPLATLDARLLLLRPVAAGLGGQITVTASSGDGNVCLRRVWSEAPELRFQVAKVGAGRWTISCSAPPSVTPGRYYLCFCELGAGEASQVVTFVACAPE